MENTVQKNNKKWLIVGGAVLAVAVIVLVLVLWVFPADKNDDKEEAGSGFPFGIKPTATRAEVVRALEDQGLRVEEKAINTDENGRYSIGFDNNARLSGIEASSLSIWGGNEGLKEIDYYFANFSDGRGYRVIRDVESAHRKVFDLLIRTLGAPEDGSTTYNADKYLTWKKNGFEYDLTEYHAMGSDGEFYFQIFVR